jgi:acetyl esterase/lipase
VRLLRGAVYGVPDGGRPLELDLWLPEEAAEPLPVVVFVHGGAWRTGLRDDPGPRFRAWRPGPFARLAAAGFAVACPGYRLSGEARHPAQRDDVAAALAWLRTRAGELGLDPGRTVLWGESAGGHVAALTALTRPAGVVGCVTWYAPAELDTTATDPGTFEARMLGAAPATDPARARDASPVAHVTPQAPPFLLLHGAGDTIIPCDQSVRLATALRQAGVPAELHLVEQADHLWVGADEAAVEECFARTLAFAAARAHLGPRS